jgi:hypothetical protein
VTVQASSLCFLGYPQEIWTDYGAELSRRVADIVTHAF